MVMGGKILSHGQPIIKHAGNKNKNYPVLEKFFLRHRLAKTLYGKGFKGKL